MALFGSTTRADNVFADQFESVDNDYFIYRRSQKGAPIEISSAERDQFVDSFIKTRQRVTWGMFLAMMAISVVAVTLFSDVNTPDAREFIYIGVGVLAACFFILWRWIWNAPSRALAGRRPQGPAMDKVDARRAGLRRTTWGQFAWAGLTVIIGGAALSSKVDLLSGWNRLWLIGGVVYVALLIWRAWQKWQADRSAG